MSQEKNMPTSSSASLMQRRRRTRPLGRLHNLPTYFYLIKDEKPIKLLAPAIIGGWWEQEKGEIQSLFIKRQYRRSRQYKPLTSVNFLHFLSNRQPKNTNTTSSFACRHDTKVGVTGARQRCHAAPLPHRRPQKKI